MLHKNTSNAPVTIPGSALDKSAWASAGTIPESVTIPPGGIVEIVRSYGCKRRSHGVAMMPMPSIVRQLSGGRLQPFGAAAIADAELFADQLPEVIIEQAKRATTGEGVAARPDPREAERKLAEDVGRRVLDATKHERAAADHAQPRILTAEEVPPGE